MPAVRLLPLALKSSAGSARLRSCRIAHYYEQNGDMMRDPDVVFVIGADQYVYPISYRQDGLGTYPESAVVEDGK